MASGKLKEVFSKYDKDQNGFISREELQSILKALGGFKDTEINSVFSHIDTNNDGKVQYKEFVDWITGSGRQDVAAKAALDPTASDDGIVQIFYNFCGDGHHDMDGKSFLKMCKDCHLIDRKCTATDVDLIFAKSVKKGQRRIDLVQFQAALALVAEKKGVSAEEVHEQILDQGSCPVLHGTKADAVRFHDDKSTYTGTHKEGGPEHVAVGAGTATQLASRGMAVGHSNPTAAASSPAAPAECTSGQLEPRPPSSPAPPSRPRPAAAAKAKAQPESSGTGSHKDTFYVFCGAHSELDGRSFAKLCKDCHLLDKKFVPGDVDTLFAKLCAKPAKRLGFVQFEEALWQIAVKKGMDYGAVLEMIARCSGPEIHATQADAVRFHDDKSTYTGTHVNGGPEHVAVGTGTATQLASHGMGVGQAK